ncbi:FAD-dependent oxidoreductase family protein [Desulforapulum autotrophicum HRM2]|uniref:FAD-dependent oxidoreductase family protein n=1 Tax=Desulforapulum autotrophicum (strain ATCC 43914 / DSM 3382 / VKM B-1955 / HRM2) TaxID=177437 RepID=C0QDQ4_DESAH|nr:hypothetical protein [Desulforapulum autotrophicum]ACN17325.1 FAD-dependent oxidoreductase family protein [Desulforapulum autotrophicum HRM2]
MKPFKTLAVFVLILFMTGNCWAGDHGGMSAASTAVTCLTQFYSAMAELPDIDREKLTRSDCKKILAFIMDNREMIIKDVARAGAGYQIARVDQIIQSMRRKSETGLGYSAVEVPRVTGETYYDEVTNHRYVKVDKDTYAEFTRKGAFFKNVPASQPHLVKSLYVHPINSDGFFLYAKQHPGKKEYLTLPAKASHPAGWYLERAFVALD